MCSTVICIRKSELVEVNPSFCKRRSVQITWIPNQAWCIKDIIIRSFVIRIWFAWQRNWAMPTESCNRNTWWRTVYSEFFLPSKEYSITVFLFFHFTNVPMKQLKDALLANVTNVCFLPEKKWAYSAITQINRLQSCILLFNWESFNHSYKHFFFLEQECIEGNSSPITRNTNTVTVTL